jgi:soluble lytic murein transglycosylase-like protein
MLEGLNDVLNRINEIKAMIGSNGTYQAKTHNEATESESEFETLLSDLIDDVKEKETAEDVLKTIDKVAASYKVDPNLIKAIVKAESDFNQNAVSKAGAIGLMQLMPQTAKALGVDPYSSSENIEGGVKYIKNMLNMFGNNIDLALSAYNAGPGNVKKYGGTPPFKETQDYIKKVNQYYREFTK